MAVQDRTAPGTAPLQQIETGNAEVLMAILVELMVHSHFLKEGLGVNDEIQMIRADKQAEVFALLGR